MSELKNRDPLVAIAGTVAGIALVIVFLFVLFAKSRLELAVWIIGILAAMGVVLGTLSARSHRRE